MGRKGNKNNVNKEPPVFYTYRKVAEITGRNIRTVYNKVYGIREEIKNGRYSEYALPDGLINWFVYVDYLTYEKDLKDKYRRKYVPEFNPEIIAEISGLKIAI